MSNVINDSYQMAMAQYRKIMAESRSRAELQATVKNDVVQDEFIVESVDNTSTNNTTSYYSEGDTIVYNGTVQALSNPNIQSYIRQHRIDEIVSLASDKFDIPENLIYKIIETESYFDKDVVSCAGAQGLMQLMPFNFDTYGVTDPFDPYQNIMAGTEHLRRYINMFDGDLKLGLAAYNAGPGNVQKYGGVPPFKETQNYIKKILGDNA